MMIALASGLTDFVASAGRLPNMPLGVVVGSEPQDGKFDHEKEQ
jgi:hypothetical protein